MENEIPPCVVEVFKVVTRLQQNGEPCRLTNICGELKPKLSRKEVTSALDFLEKQGKIDKAADRQYIANETPTDQPAT